MSDEQKIRLSLVGIAVAAATLVVTTIVSVVVGQSVTRWMDARVLSVQSVSLGNGVARDVLARSAVTASYKLVANPTQEVKSYFTYIYWVKNSSSVVADDIVVSVKSQTDAVVLIKDPKIALNPPDISRLMTPQHHEIEDPKVDEWSVPFLNPGESIRFTYNAYSESEMNDAVFSAIARKKDWTTTEGSGFQSAILSLTFPFRYGRPWSYAGPVLAGLALGIVIGVCIGNMWTVRKKNGRQ